MERLFVAVELPGEVREALSFVQDALKASRARLTLVDPGIIHITLKFIGDVPESHARKIGEVLGQVKAETFLLRVRGIGGNNPRQPRVIWADIDDGGKCSLLHAQIEDLLAPLGVEREARAFCPHATVARVKEFHPDLLEHLKPFRERDFGCGMVQGFTLKKSTLTPRGPVYQDVKEVCF
ncbi:MAG: 2',5' RNA ligase family [Methanoregulaceae archaeon PtaB.Bin056]|nr:MAG: 2',5' RNA ligase family [Methanoregulaceae archaeon PtaB.Bin056]